MSALNLRPGTLRLLELAVVIAVVALLTTTFLKSVQFYQAQAERMAAQQVVNALRSALRLQVLQLIVQGRQADFVTLAAQNPMDWLALKPVNYLGEVDAPGTETIAPGSWYFDRSEMKLIYIYRDKNYFTDVNEKALNLKLKLITIRSDAIGKHGNGDMVSGISLE